MIIVDTPHENGWSAEFTHALRRGVNKLAARRQIDEHVHVTLFTPEEFQAREDLDEPLADNNTGVIDQALTRDQQDRPRGETSRQTTISTWPTPSQAEPQGAAVLGPPT